MHHLNCSTSDHSPLWILPEILDPTIQEKPFWFEEMWLAKKGCIDIGTKSELEVRGGSFTVSCVQWL